MAPLSQELEPPAIPERFTAIFSLIESCKLSAIDPEAYLRDILARIADHKINRIAELLPWVWKTTQTA